MLRKRVISRLVAIQCRQAFYYFIFLVCAFAYMGILLPAAWAAKKPAHHSSRTSPKKPDYTSEFSIEGQLKKYLGVAYRRGGCTWNGMDCSGFTKVIYREVFGVDIPHGSASQHALPTMQKISLEDLRTGDLIFFSPNRKKRRINHVGVYLSDGRFIHATPKDGVIVSSLSEPYWKAKIYAAKKMVNVDFPGHDVPANVSLDLALAPKPSDAITIQFTGFAPPSPDLGRERNSVFDEPRTDLLSSQLGWQKSLFLESSDFLLSAFREYYYLREPTGSYDLSGKNQDDGFSLHTSDFSFVQGIRMASDFEPLRGLNVTPSLTYFSYGGRIDDVDLPRLTYGMNFSVAPPSNEWAISMGLQLYGLRSTSSLLMDRDDHTLMGMTITYHHRLKNNFQLFFTSEYSKRLLPGLDDGTFDEIKEDQKFSVMLNFSY